MLNPEHRLTRWVTCLTIMLSVLAAQVAFGATAEHTATLETFAGEVKVLKGGTASVTPALRMVLRSKDVVYTGKTSSATIVFPDGSAIQLEPKTRFTIQLLEYAPGGPRKRSFSLHYGAVVARISRFFGAGSKASISTPTAVAAARGTGFRLSYDLLTKMTILSVADGAVEFSCGGITTLCHAGETVISKGLRPGAPQQTAPGAPGQFVQAISDLGAFEVPPAVQPPSILEAVLPSEAPAGPPEPTPLTAPLPVEPVVLPPVADLSPGELPGLPPPFTPVPSKRDSGTQTMNWTVPGILGAGVLAAVLMQNGGGLRVEPSNPVIPEPTNPIPEPTVPIPEPTNPVPEPASLIVMGLGVTGLIGRAMRIRSRKGK